MRDRRLEIRDKRFNFSDPVQLLLQDSYSSLKNKDYQSMFPKPIYRRQVPFSGYRNPRNLL